MNKLNRKNLKNEISNRILKIEKEIAEFKELTKPIAPDCAELNPCEQVWKHIKSRYKNQNFNSMKELREWLHIFVRNMTKNTIMSITGNHYYYNAFNPHYSQQ